MRGGSKPTFYVEGWALRDDGTAEPFEHGWVEWSGFILDVSPHHHVASGGYFGALRLQERDVDPTLDAPFYRDAYAKPGHPKFDHEVYERYSQARAEASRSRGS